MALWMKTWSYFPHMVVMTPYVKAGFYHHKFPPTHLCFISKSPPANNTVFLRRCLEHMQQVSPATPWPQPKLSWRSEATRWSESSLRQLNPSQVNHKRISFMISAQFEGNLSNEPMVQPTPPKNGPVQMGKIWLWPNLVWWFVSTPLTNKGVKLDHLGFRGK